MDVKIKRFSSKLRPKGNRLLKRAISNSNNFKMQSVVSQMCLLCAALERYDRLIVHPNEGYVYGPQLATLSQNIRERWQTDDWPQNVSFESSLLGTKNELLDEINFRLECIRKKARAVRQNVTPQQRNTCDEIIQFIDELSVDDNYDFLNDYSDKSGSPSPQPSDDGYKGN